MVIVRHVGGRAVPEREHLPQGQRRGLPAGVKLGGLSGLPGATGLLMHGELSPDYSLTIP